MGAEPKDFVAGFDFNFWDPQINSFHFTEKSFHETPAHKIKFDGAAALNNLRTGWFPDGVTLAL